MLANISSNLLLPKKKKKVQNEYKTFLTFLDLLDHYISRLRYDVAQTSCGQVLFCGNRTLLFLNTQCYSMFPQYKPKDECYLRFIESSIKMPGRCNTGLCRKCKRRSFAGEQHLLSSLNMTEYHSVFLGHQWKCTRSYCSISGSHIKVPL